MGQLLGDQKLDERIAEIKAVIERMDFRWDQGFVTDKDEYLEQRVKLQQELEQLTPVADDDVAVAADLLENFEAHWEATGGDRKEQQRLIQLVVARVWVREEKVVAMSLRPNYHITLGLESEKPTPVTVGNKEDGDQTLVHRRERRGSHPHWVHDQVFIWAPRKRVYHLVIRELLKGVQEWACAPEAEPSVFITRIQIHMSDLLPDGGAGAVFQRVLLRLLMLSFVSAPIITTALV